MAIFFYKGKENILESKNEQGPELSEQPDLKKIQDAFLKVLDNKNLSFLLGSGCSSYEIEQALTSEEQALTSEEQALTSEEQALTSEEQEIEERTTEKKSEKETVQVGVPVMFPMAKEFYNSANFAEEKDWLNTELQIDVTDSTFSTNLETFLSTLHSLSFYHSKKSKLASDNSENESTEKEASPKEFKDLTEFERIESIILKARNFLLQKCLNEDNIKVEKEKPSNDLPLIELYKQFYRKLLTRNPTLPRLNIFTTNYDLYSERAMDLLGIHYVNGFTGGISKFFNPAIFNYALAEKMDLSQSKWSVIDNFFYLYKIHGSVNWIEAEGENKLFKVKEIQEPTFKQLENEATIMIHPTPLKYNASLGSPYSDLFREFQKKLMQNNNILVTIGYSFSDEHINNIIFQAFTIPSFRLIVIAEPTNAIAKLQELNDSRIWIIGENSSSDKNNNIPLHFFKRFVEEILPDLTAEDLDKKMETTINNLKDLLK
jgi:hypothetical protein